MRKNLQQARQNASMTQQQVADRLKHRNYKFLYDGNIIVCDDGALYKRYRDGSYSLVESSQDGYIYVAITTNGKTKRFAAHRLVAEAFISNPCMLPQVNHIDGNKTNNRVENLEWCDALYNVRDAVKRHSPRYLTNLRRLRTLNGISQGEMSVRLHILLGAYRDIENAVIKPIPMIVEKLEKMYGYEIDYLLAEAKEEVQYG